MQINTTELISLMRSKDERGLNVLYDQYAPALMGQIVNVVGDRMVAEEVLQECLLKIWNGIDSYDEKKAGLFAWMNRIARNAAIDKGRLKSFQRHQKTEQLTPYVYKIEDRGISTSGIDVDRITKNLDDKYKDVLDHVYLMGYTQKETAEALDIPLGTVKTRLRSAVSTLRETLKNEKNLLYGFIAISLLLIILLLWT